MTAVLVINSGSSSMKYRLIDARSGDALAVGLMERIGESGGHSEHRIGEQRFESAEQLPDHQAAFTRLLAAFAEHGPRLDDLAAVGHRVVQGGARYRAPALITDAVEADIAAFATLAPLHNPANLVGIHAARFAFPSVPHVAVFDTAFHQTMPEAAYTYAIDAETAKQYGIRRYGFHGTSHQFVAREAAQALGLEAAEANLIIFHLGNGASVCAVRAGRSVDTSMGMTPLEGLVMGTRSGDLDPAILLHLQRVAGFDADALDTLLNQESGLKGLSGHRDMRDVIAADTDAARLALKVYVHRARGYLGNYALQLGRVDAVVFTAGVGEHSPEIRAAICANLEQFGIALDPAANEASSRVLRDISTTNSPVRVLVVPTNEELEIARQTAATIGSVRAR